MGEMSGTFLREAIIQLGPLLLLVAMWPAAMLAIHWSMPPKE